MTEREAPQGGLAAPKFESSLKEKSCLTNATRYVTQDLYILRLFRSSNAVGEYESL
jgi:hypothetical protein